MNSEGRDASISQHVEFSIKAVSTEAFMNCDEGSTCRKMIHIYVFLYAVERVLRRLSATVPLPIGEAGHRSELAASATVASSDSVTNNYWT